MKHPINPLYGFKVNGLSNCKRLLALDLATSKLKSRLISMFLVAISLVGLGQVGYVRSAINSQHATNVNANTQSVSKTSQTFKRIFIVQFENKAYEAVIVNSYFANLASRGMLLTNSYALAHPSQPNYLAQVGGDTFVNDNNSHNLPQSNLVDLLEGANISWKTYQEDYPGNCYAGSSSGLYVRKHNPFISFDNVRTNNARCLKIVNANQLNSDIANNALPQFSYFTPNLNNDAHDTNIAYAANWLSGFLEPKLTNSNFISETLVVVTFDEDDSSHQNHIYTVLLGPGITPGTDSTRYTHYSLLRTVEDNFNLGNLGRNDVTAQVFRFITQPVTSTSTTTPTPTPTSTPKVSDTQTSNASPTHASGTATPTPQNLYITEISSSR